MPKEVKTEKHAGGRPQMYSVDEIAEIVLDLNKYIEDNDDPTVVGFTSTYLKHPVNKDYINNHEEFCELRKRAIEKQEAFLLHNATLNKANPTIAIFRLKQPQHGYRDKTEVDANITGEYILSGNQAEQLIRARANRSNISRDSE